MNDEIKLEKPKAGPLELWAIVCGHGQVHVDETCEAYLEKEHAEEGLCLVADYDEECGPHKIVKFRQVR